MIEKLDALAALPPKHPVIRTLSSRKTWGMEECPESRKIACIISKNHF
jgi:hypothetical protein